MSRPICPIAFTDEKLSAHAGLEIFRRFVERSGLVARLRDLFAIRRFDNDYSSWRLALAVIGMLLLGGRDCATCATSKAIRSSIASRGSSGCPPIARSRAGSRISAPACTTACTTSCARSPMTRPARSDSGAPPSTWTARCCARASVSMAPSAASTPTIPRTSPTARSRAQTGQLLGVWNRPGNTNDSVGALGPLRFRVDDLRAALGAIPLEVRLDGAFCQPQILHFLVGAGVEWAMKVPLWEWLPIRGAIAQRRRWKRVAPGLQGFFLEVPIPKWGLRLRVAVFRKHVSHRSRKNFQLDLFSPDDGRFEYSAIASNKRVRLATVWGFMAGRGGHEKTLGELKQHLGFETIPTDEWGANSAWQLLCALTLNVVRQLQLATIAPARPNGRKRTYRHVLRSLRTLRFELLHVPARLVRTPRAPHRSVRARAGDVLGAAPRPPGADVTFARDLRSVSRFMSNQG